MATNSYTYFTSRKQGDIIYLGQDAVNEASYAVSDFIDFIKNSFTSLFYLLFIFYLSFWLTIGVIILGVAYVILIKNLLFSRVFRNSSELIKANMERSVVYQEFITGIKTIFITDSVTIFRNRYTSVAGKLLKTYTNVNALSKLISIVNDFIMFSMIALGAILLYIFTGGNFISYIGIFGTLMLALYRLIPCVNTAQNNLQTVIRALPALMLIYDELQDRDASYPHSGISHPNAGTGKKYSFRQKIEFRNVTFSYPSASRDIIHNLSFTIVKNKKIAIVGNSGSGKTTTANLLALLYQPKSGCILIDDVRINEINRTEYLKSLGYIGQETFIFHDTITENIRFGLERTNEEIIAAAKLADAHEFIINTDKGYNTIIGDQGLKLSGGQRQRIAIARIILRNPDILLLDEATSSLDNISERKIIDSVQKLSEKMTVITIAHRLSTIQNADIILVMKEGVIVESGTHNDLMAKNGEYYQLYIGQKKDDLS